MPKKKVVDETKKVNEELSTLPSDEKVEKKTAKKPATKKTTKAAKEKPIDENEELNIDGQAANTEETVLEEVSAKEVVAEVEQTEVTSEGAEETEELLVQVDKIAERLHQIYGTRRSIKRQKASAKKEYSKSFATTDGWKNDGIKVENEYDLLREETSILAQAVDNSTKEIKTIHITGVEPDEDIGWVLVGHLQKDNPQYKIKIALSEFVAFTQTDFEGLKITNNDDLVSALRDIASHWIGTDLQVVITKVYEAHRMAYASRLMASELLARWYFRKNVKGKTHPAFTVGSKVKAQIVEVKRDRVRVSVYGQDAWVSADECFWVFSGPLYDTLHAGQWVNVVILDAITDWLFETNEKQYHLAKLQVSIKQTRPNPAAKNFENYYKGGIYEAKPIFVKHENGKIMCTLGEGEKSINILCAPSAVGVLGNRVKVMIDGKDENTYRIWGHIVAPNVR